MRLTTQQRQAVEALCAAGGYTDYRWIDPADIIVAQWVRMKCLFGCGEYGRGGTCPPNTPTVAECERFFSEYGDAVVLHFEGRMARPEDRHAWSRNINAGLIKLERAVFLAGFERAFMLFMDSCGFCETCSGERAACKEPRLARPSPEAMAVDVYSTVRRCGLPIAVRTDYDQKMDRYAFLLVR